MNPEEPDDADHDQVNADATEVKGTGEVIISLEGVYKRFGDFTALSNVNLNVGRQEVVVVIGPSGSGKSTMIRCINRLEEHDAGRIVVDGTELSADIRNIQEIRRETGMVFQQFNLFPHLSVIDNVTLAPRQVRRMPKSEAIATGNGTAEACAHSRAGVTSTRGSSPAGSNSASRSRARWR